MTRRHTEVPDGYPFSERPKPAAMSIAEVTDVMIPGYGWRGVVRDAATGRELARQPVPAVGTLGALRWADDERKRLGGAPEPLYPGLEGDGTL